MEKNITKRKSKNDDQNKASSLLQEIRTCGACPWGADLKHADDFIHLEDISQNWQLDANFCKSPVSIFPSIILSAQGQFNMCTLYVLRETETKKVFEDCEEQTEEIETSSETHSYGEERQLSQMG